MTLRRKTVIILSLAFICLVGIYYAFTRTVLTNNFNELEEHFSRQYAQRATVYLENETQQLATLTRNWATWDDIYEFMDDRNPDFVNSNLTDETLFGLRINFVIITDLAGNIVHVNGIDLETGTHLAPDAAGIAGNLGAVLRLDAGPVGSVSGFVSLSGQPSIFALEPILDSSSGGAARGSLVFSRYLSEVEIAGIAAAVEVPVSVFDIGDTALPAAVFFSGPEYFTEALDDKVIASYAVVADVTDAPLLVLRTEMPRRIYQQARNIFTYTTLLFVVTGLIVITLALLFLERSILARVSNLSWDVARIGTSSNLSQRVRVFGRDEIAMLGTSINSMLYNLQLLNTERETTRSALFESEEHFRSVTDTATDAILTFETNGRMYYLNQSARRVLGYDDFMILGKPIHSIFPAKERKKLDRLIEEARRNTDSSIEKAQRREIFAHRRDGSVFPAEVSVASWKTQQGRFFTAIIHDVTERQQNQEELEKRNLELQRANTAKSDFLAQMSHELRTPLNAILGFSELLSDNILGELNEEQVRCINDIYLSGQHLLNLIDDVLDLSKVEAGKIGIEADTIRIAEVVADVLREIRPVMDKAGQTAVVEVSDELPLVTADLKMVRQVLFNLLSNASKFSPEGSEIKIAAGPTGGFLQIGVSDRGIGIQKEYLEKIFEAFYQADTKGDKAREGTGLGLNISKQYVTIMGGKIWAESTYGKGSTFHFTIPLNR